MLLGLLRFIAYGLMFWFIYRVVIGALRYLAGDSQPKVPPRSEEPPAQNKSDPSIYRDVKDAQFKDLPDDTQKPS